MFDDESVKQKTEYLGKIKNYCVIYCFVILGISFGYRIFFKHCHRDFNGKYRAIENGR